MSFFTRNHKKALVRLQQVDKVTCQVVKELGFGFKARKEGNRLIVVTCSSVLPEDIQVDEIVVDRFRSKSKNKKYEINPQDQVTVESIHMPKQDGIRYLSGTGGNEEEFFYMDNKDDIRKRTLSAFAFEDKKIVELQFENKQGTWHFTWKSNKDFDVKKAKGAPIICKARAGSVFVIGLLSTNSSGQLYPLLFTKDFDVPRPPSDEPSQASDQHSDQRSSTSSMAGNEPSQASDQHSDQRPSTSGVAGDEPSQASDQHSDPRTASIDAVNTEPSQPSEKYSGATVKDNAKAAGGNAQFIKDVESPEEDNLSSKAKEFVEKRQLPEKKGTSDKMWTLIAGLLGRKKDEELMDQLIEKIKPQDKYHSRNKLLLLHCLYEYRDDELSKRVINKLHDEFRAMDGAINFVDVEDTDCSVICYLLSIFKLSNEERTRNHPKSTQSFVINGLIIARASISLLGVTVLLEALPKFDTLTKLVLYDCGLNDACFQVIAQILASTKITHLELACDRITAQALRDICAVLSGCRVEWLCLADCGLDDECFKIISQTLPTTRITHLDLMLNSNITAQAIRDICAALSGGRVEEFKMFWCGLDDECIKIIAQTLPNTSITHLNLGNNNKITDEGVMYLCTEVSVRDCHVKEINLLGNPNITDRCIGFVKSLLEQSKPDVRLEI